VAQALAGYYFGFESCALSPKFFRTGIQVKRFLGINRDTLSPAEADTDGELGLYDSFRGGLEVKFKTLFGILSYS
jgi:hypothetical protein